MTPMQKALEDTSRTVWVVLYQIEVELLGRFRGVFSSEEDAREAIKASISEFDDGGDYDIVRCEIGKWEDGQSAWSEGRAVGVAMKPGWENEDE